MLISLFAFHLWVLLQLEGDHELVWLITSKNLYNLSSVKWQYFKTWQYLKTNSFNENYNWLVFPWILGLVFLPVELLTNCVLHGIGNITISEIILLRQEGFNLIYSSFTTIRKGYTIWLIVQIRMPIYNTNQQYEIIVIDI